MTMARSQLVNTSVTRWYHCISRCVRRAFLLGEGTVDRKQWIENRLRELADVFAVSIGGFSVLDNHLHVLVRLGDLNPVAARIATTPEASEHTSIKLRIEHVEAEGRTEDLKAA